MELSKPQSHLQNLIRELLLPLKDNPDLLLTRVIGKSNAIKLNGLLNNPIARSFIPPAFNLEEVIATVLNKFDEIPTNFWEDLENLLIGVCLGDSEKIAKAREMLGGVVIGAD